MNNNVMRNKSIATGLSIVIPGLGHAYAGKLIKGISIYILFFFVFSFFFFRQFTYSNLITLLLMDLARYGIWIYAIIDSLLSKNTNIISHNRLYSLLLMPIILILAISIALYFDFPKRFKLNNYQIDTGIGTSMWPTFKESDRIVVKYGCFNNGDVKRGDIVTFKAKSNSEFQNSMSIYQKRVVGIPGDTLFISNCKVTVNNNHLSEEYAYIDTAISFYFNDTSKYIYSEHYSLRKSGDSTITLRDSLIVLMLDYQFYTISTPPLILGYMEYYVLGDNRLNSYDSRDFGPISLTQIKGIAQFIYKPYWRMRRL